MPKIKKIPSAADITAVKKVAVYARVSIETDKLANSLSAQISYYNELIKRNPEWEFAGIYADRFISGTAISKRAEFRKLISDCDKGLIDLILCKSISRFSRNTVDLLNTVRHLKELNVEVWFEKENISSLSGDGELMLSILAGFAQEEARSISENIKWAIRKGYEKGKVRNTVCYGYRVVNGKFEIEENEAQVVRQIFEWYLGGDSCYAIKNKLNSAGVKSYYGKQFTSARISNMLRQEKYAGKNLLQKYYVNNYMDHKEIRNRGEYPMYMVNDSHEPIISQDIFDAVQREISKRYGVSIVNGIAQKDEYLNRPKGSKAVKSSYPRRKAVLSDEKKAELSLYFSSRSSYKKLRYDLSMFIKCEACGQNLTAKKKKFADGTTELWWECFKHSCVSRETPRPKVIQDAALKKQIADILDAESFSTDIMEKQLMHISISGDILTFHFRDGHSVTTPYIPCKRHKSRKDK